jgi:negative regulator of the PHO system
MATPDQPPTGSMGPSPSESKEAIKSGYQPPASSTTSHHDPSPEFTTASLYGSKDALAILNQTITPASLLFDPKYTSRERPSPRPPFRTFPPSPSAQRDPVSVPSTISLQTLDKEEPPATMDKRHPSSFQQLEKLGEGTYATVCAWDHNSMAALGFVRACSYIEAFLFLLSCFRCYWSVLT